MNHQTPRRDVTPDLHLFVRVPSFLYENTHSTNAEVRSIVLSESQEASTLLTFQADKRITQSNLKTGVNINIDDLNRSNCQAQEYSVSGSLRMASPLAVRTL